MMIVNGTGAEDKTCYGDGTGDGESGGDRNNGAGGGSTEWMRLLSLSVLSETFGPMAKAKASSSKNREKPEVGKSKNKIARKGKAAKKLVKNSSKTAGIKIGGLLRVQQPLPLVRLGQIQEVHVRKT